MAFRWTCAADGECCRQVGAVVMTLAESAVLRRAAPPGVVLQMDGLGDGRRVQLRPTDTGACPLLGGDGRCTVHPVRPYNCRRFACLRHDKTTEPLVVGGPMGCINTEYAVRTNPEARVFYAAYQRTAQRWGRAMGWTEDMA